VTYGQTDRQTDGQTDGQTDRRRRSDPLVSPLLTAGDTIIKLESIQVLRILSGALYEQKQQINSLPASGKF